MSWLAQNLLWIALLAGVFFLMRRSGMGFGCGHAHGGAHQGHGNASGSNAGPAAPNAQTRVDAVSGQPVDLKSAVTSVYLGQAYYFATRENRDRFESAPERYAMGNSNEKATGHSGHRHGCC